MLLGYQRTELKLSPPLAGTFGGVPETEECQGLGSSNVLA